MLQVFGQKRLFYGYFIVAGSMFALFVSMGARNGLGVFINPMEADGVWQNRTAIAAVIGLGTLVNALTQPFFGNLYDRYGGRAVISGSLLLLGVSTITLAFTQSIGPEFSVDVSILGGLLGQFELNNSLVYMFIIYSVLMSMASSGVSLVTVHAMLSKWYLRNRAKALSIATAGTSAGGLLLTPFSASLILWADWRFAWVALGLFVLLLALPLAYIILRDSPDEVGENPDGDAVEVTGDTRVARPTAVVDRRTPLQTEVWKDSLKSSPFWQLSSAYFVCGITTIIISAHFVPFAIDMGISSGIAAMAFGLSQGLNVVGVIVAGMLADKYSRKNVLGTIYFLRFLAYVMLVLPGFALMFWGIHISPMIGIWSFAVLAGMSWLATPPLTSSLTADIYGVRNIGTLNGLSTMSHQIGGAMSVYLAGVLYDRFGAYEIPFAIAGLFLLGATIASYSVNERKFSLRYQTTQTTPSPATAGGGD